MTFLTVLLIVFLGAFIMVKSLNYLDERMEESNSKKDKNEYKLSERVNNQHMKSSYNNSFSFGWIIFMIIFGSCWYGFNALQDLPDVDPADYLSPEERKEICYEVYDTPDLRGELIACIARVNSDS